MVNQNKDRVPDGTLAGSSLQGTTWAGSGACVVFIRLWAAEGKRMDCRAARAHSPLLSLVLDTLQTSGGVAGAENAEFVSATFGNSVSGLQCARRIQWALEGMREYEAFREAAATIVVDAWSGAYEVAEPSLPEWERTGPGKILVQPGALDSVDGLPGVTLANAAPGASREWAWKSAQANGGFAADEQAVLSMLQAAGRPDPVAYAPAAEAASTQVFTRAPELAAERRGSAERAGSYARDEDERAEKPNRMPLVAAAVGVLLLVVGGAFFLMRKPPVQSAAPSTTPAAAPDTRPAQGAAADSQPAAQVPAQGAHATPVAPSKRAKLTDLLKKVVPEQKPEAPAAAPVVSHCDLTEEEIQRSLARADRYMHDGELSDARAAYQHVQGCPSARERAQAGLTRIQRMAAQNGPGL